jgi:hypothetical protein
MRHPGRPYDCAALPAEVFGPPKDSSPAPAGLGPGRRYYFGTTTGRNGLDSPDWGGREAQVTDMVNPGGRHRETYDIFDCTEQIQQPRPDARPRFDLFVTDPAGLGDPR